MEALIFIIFIVFYLYKKGVISGNKKSRSSSRPSAPPRPASPDDMSSRETIFRSEGRSNGAAQFRMPSTVARSVSASRRQDDAADDDRFAVSVNNYNYSTGSQNVSISQLRAGESRDGMSALIEDRQHDWLARQLREEKRAKKRGESLLDLGASHDASCDAREVKRLHILQHDDSIDNGEL